MNDRCARRLSDRRSGQIRLFTTVFPESDPHRRNEYRQCLERNAACDWIDEICLLSEGDDQNLPEHGRFVVRRVETRPTYRQYFHWITELAAPEDVSILSNADIFFDPHQQVLREWRISEGTALALARWNEIESGVFHPFVRNDSQDVWVFRGPLRDIEGDFPIGVPRCDNRILHEIRRAGYAVINPGFSIRAYHLHAGEWSEYPDENQTHYVDPPYAYLWPHNLWSLPRTLIFNLRHPRARVSWRLDRRRLGNTMLGRLRHRVKAALAKRGFMRE